MTLKFVQMFAAAISVCDSRETQLRKLILAPNSMAYSTEAKRTLLTMFGTMVMITFAVTILALIQLLPMDPKHLNLLVFSFVGQLVVTAIGFLKKGAFLEDGGVEKDLNKYQPSEPAAVLLATLWKYQLRHGGMDKTKRWLIGLPPDIAAHAAYYRGLAELIEVGLAEINRPNLMAMLTSAGFTYCQKDSERWNTGLSYDF